mgnify:FL=1
MSDNNKSEETLFNYKTLRIVMMGFGSLMMTLGGAYAYFIVTTVGFDALDEVIWPLVISILAIPAGLLVYVVGKKIKKPILDNPENQ